MNTDADIQGPSHRDIQELLGAYALDAVPEDERRLVEAHLSTCASCRAEVDQHRSAAAMLASAGAPAPSGLWDRISESLETPPAVDLGSERVRRARMRGAPSGLGRVAAIVAAAAAVIGIAGLSVKVVQQDRVLDRLVATDEQRGLVQAANTALLDAGSTRVTLASEDGTVVVDAVVSPDGTGYLVRDNLRPLPAGRTYQLWALDEGVPISVGVLGRDPEVVAFSLDPRVGGLAITEERGGGVVAPENDPIVLGEVQTT